MDSSNRPFVALTRVAQRGDAPIIALDIGYSSSKPSCGIAWSGDDKPICCQFGKAIDKVFDLWNQFDHPIVVIEAALSTYHQPRSGNPSLRGEFEKGRGWYWGPGAVSLVAARRFLEEFATRIPLGKTVLLAEAFLSNKDERTAHVDDAEKIVKEFWNVEPCVLAAGAEIEPVTSLINGVPSIRVF